MSRSHWEAIPDVWDCSGDPTAYPKVVGRPSWMSVWPSRISGSGEEAISDVREWSGSPPGCQVAVRRPSWI